MGIERVLYVDDEEDIRRIGELSLVNVGGLQVELAASGPEALEKLRATAAPDVILLDVMMPKMDGPTTLERIRELPGMADVPVIFLTAKVQPKEKERLLALGAAGVIPKPFDPMSLADRVRGLVGG